LKHFNANVCCKPEKLRAKTNDLWHHVLWSCICFQKKLLTYGQVMEKRTLCCDVKKLMLPRYVKTNSERAGRTLKITNS